MGKKQRKSDGTIKMVSRQTKTMLQEFPKRRIEFDPTGKHKVRSTCWPKATDVTKTLNLVAIISV